jgi:hypothetical protein
VEQYPDGRFLFEIRRLDGVANERVTDLIVEPTAVSGKSALLGKRSGGALIARSTS